ncbi:MAG: hypothetical protein MUO68_10770, partial [Desulfobacteraceae bacterium]|nr:hypothetical protein [Desulfobacteraceae bacterium]
IRDASPVIGHQYWSISEKLPIFLEIVLQTTYLKIKIAKLVSIHKWLFSVPPPTGRQTQILAPEILQCIPVVKIFVFLDLAIPPQAGLISGWTQTNQEDLN